MHVFRIAIVLVSYVFADQKCSHGSPDGCSVWDVQLSKKYSAGRLVKVDGGNDVYKATDVNSCPLGWRIWAPQSQADWETVVNSIDIPKKPNLLVDVTRKEDGCGGCREYAMNSGVPEQSSWVTSDGQPWWLRATPYKEPSGDYKANCYMAIRNTSPDDVQMNDGYCLYHSTSYLCQPIHNMSTCESVPANIWLL